MSQESSSFSWSKTLKTCDNNDKAAKIMLERFDKFLLDSILSQLHQSLLKEDYSDVSHQFHTLWINFLYIGGINGEKIIKELENTSLQINNQELCSIYLELLDECSEIKKQIGKLLSKTPQSRDLKDFEKDIKNIHPHIKPSNCRSNIGSNLDLENTKKEPHCKKLQGKIEEKESKLYKKHNRNITNNKVASKEYAVNSKIIDYTLEQQPILDLKTNIEASNNKNIALKSDFYIAKETINSNIPTNNGHGHETKNTNLGLGINVNTKVQSNSNQHELLTDQTKNVQKDPRPIIQSYKLPEVSELDKNEQNIKQTLSLSKEPNTEVFLEGKKESRKNACCGVF